MSAKPKPQPLLALARTDAPFPPQGLVVECIEAKHPTLTGRVKVQWTDEAGDHAIWMPTLQGLAIRVGDRLLAQQPHNWEEPVVVGIVDGFARRQTPDPIPAASLTLEDDEAVAVCAPDGRVIFDVARGEAGPQITFRDDDLEVCVDGRLTMQAKTISLVAREGEARIKSCDDVVIEGENIHLN